MREFKCLCLWSFLQGIFFKQDSMARRKQEREGGREKGICKYVFFAKGVTVEHVESLLPILKVQESQKVYYGCRFEITDSYTAKVSVQPSGPRFCTPVH